MRTEMMKKSQTGLFLFHACISHVSACWLTGLGFRLTLKVPGGSNELERL